jgi:pantoate--beta-alanine ligase
MVPIVRANDGLALSSRNAYLSDEERKQHPAFTGVCTYIEKQIRDGVDTPKLLIEHQKSELEAKGFKIDYLDVFSIPNAAAGRNVSKGRAIYLPVPFGWVKHD